MEKTAGMVERVALAIKRAQINDAAELSTSAPWREWELSIARAAIEAMRDLSRDVDDRMSALAANGNTNWRDYVDELINASLSPTIHGRINTATDEVTDA